ncbi:MAG: PQQ-like beta-propeller repeat protein [Xanthomonadales bacterium]|nr:PQQ-like beta-propeller repeat protein [Xanthomonadales bacterium]
MRQVHPGQRAGLFGFCCAVALLWLAGPALALTPQWQQLSIGGVGDPHAVITDLATLPDGGAVATGTYSDHYDALVSGMLTVRFDADGQVLWSTRLEATTLSDKNPRVAVASDGTIYAAMSIRIPSLSGMQSVLVAYAPGQGEQLWINIMEGFTEGMERSLRLGLGPDGHLVLVSQRIGVDGSRWHARKLSSLDGSVLWQTDWPVSGTGKYTRVRDFGFLSTSDVVLVGTTDMEEGGYTLGMLRLSAADGSVVWARRQPGDPLGSEGLALVAGPDDQLTLLSVGGDWDGDLRVSRLGADGTPAWTTTLPLTSRFSTPGFIALAGNGDVLAAAPVDDKNHLYRLAGDGGLLWNASLPQVADISRPELTGMAIDGELLHLARRYDTYEWEPSYWAQLLTVDPSDGQALWQATLPLPHIEHSPDVGLRLGGDGRLFHFSTHAAAANNFDFRVDSYRSSDGEPLWTAHEIDQQMPDSLNCPGLATRTRISGVTPDGGTVFMGCRHLDADTRLLYVEKLSAGGQRLWSRAVADAIDSQARPVALDVDAAGDIHLAVTWAGAGEGASEGERELVSLRLAGSTGTELQRQVHGTYIDGDQIGSFSQHLDPAGWRHVTWPVTDGGGPAIALARFVPASSQADWSVQIPVPAKTTFVLSLTGLDGNGNPVLGGWRHDDGATTGSPILQVHSAEDGALLWNDADDMSGEVQATLVHPDGDLIVARGAYLGQGLRFSRHSAAGAEVWRSPVFRPAGSVSASAAALLPADNGDVFFAGVSTEPWVGGFPQFSILGRINGADGRVKWMQHHVDMQVRYAHVNALMLTPDGKLRTAGMDADAGVPLQAVIVDHDPDTGQRLATHAMDGLLPVRLHETAPGSYRLLSNLSTLEGLRIRVKRLEHSEMIFRDGFEVGAR